MDSINPDPKDRLYQKLTELGYDLEVKRLNNDNPDSCFVGYFFKTDTGAFIYRIEEDDETVFLTYYKSLSNKQGLSNSFKGFFWFLNFISQPEFKLKRITSHIDHTEKNCSFTSNRFIEFLKKVGGQEIFDKWGSNRLTFDLKYTGTLRQQYRQFAKSLKKEKNLFN